MNKKSLAIIVIIVLQIAIIANLIYLNLEIKNLNMIQVGNSSNDAFRLESKIDDLSKKIDDNSNFLSDFFIKNGELNTKTYMYPMTINVVPKEYSDYTEISVKLNSELITLKQERDVFKATVQADARLDYDISSVIIKSDGISRTQKIKRSENTIKPLLTRLFAEINSYYTGQVGFGSFDKNGLATIDFNENWEIGIDDEGKELGVKDLAYLVKINDEIVFNGEIENINLDNNGWVKSAQFSLKEKFELRKDQKIRVVLLADFEDGFTYERVLESYDPSDPEWDDEDIYGVIGKYIIKDKNGNVVIDSSVK